MKPNKILRNILILLILLSSIGCDQVSKNIVRHNIEFNQKIVVIDNFMTITKIENAGAFLSLGQHLPRIIYKLLFILIPFLALSFGLYYLLRHNSLPKSISLGICLVISGGLGNLIDRILYGSVTDFLYFNFGIFHTGIVNIADIAITTGFIILFIKILLSQNKLVQRTV